ncbi:tetrahydrofolate synthase [Hypoxylon texense]
MTSSNVAATEIGRQLLDHPPPLSAAPPASDLGHPDPVSTTTATAIATTSIDANANAPMPLANYLDTFRDDPHDPHEVHSIPSPPTVSPLSTPAATQINIGDNDDVPDLPAEPLTVPNSATESSAVQAASLNLALATEAFSMKLDQTDQANRARSQVEAVATTDPEPTNTDFASRNMGTTLRQAQATVDPNAYMMNIAQATSALFQTPQNPGPSIVAPSEVSLQASFTQESDALTTSADVTSTSASQKLESFARIEFADSVFQMTTYAVIIGRDQRAMDQARRDEKRELNYRRKVEENARSGLPPPTPINFDRGKFSKSYVSEEGGMLGPESDGEDNVRPVKKRRPSSANKSQNGDDDAQSDRVKSNRQYVSHTPGAAAVDLGTLQPSPSHIPFVGIHSPGPDIASKTRGISRQHLKIEFNEKRGAFEAIALHKNGFFCDDTHYGLDDPVTLRSGDRLQIKDVEFTFIVNGVELGKTGGEEYHEEETSSKRMSIGGKEMSFDFEHSDHENFRDTSEELSEIGNVPTPAIVSDEAEEDQEAAEPPSDTADVPEMADESRIDMVESTEGQDMSQSQFMNSDLPKRRGPGRPPKDGIMSKRERRLLKKQMQETSKKTVPQEPDNEKIKRPVGRPRKNPAPEDGEKPEKRKYNKRKPKEDGEEGSEAEKRAKEKKEKKVRPKSPPLELRKEDFTEEQLQKPSKNYGVLIDEALTNGPPDGLTLKQIYKRIMSKYPWFYFSAETKGWESSVRHNLIGNEAFKKAEGTGLWSRVPGVELDAGKKRKASSPDRQLGSAHHHAHLPPQHYYTNGSYLPANNMGFPNSVPNYSIDAKQPQAGYQHAPGPPNQSHQTPSSQPVTQQAYSTHTPAPAQLSLGYLSRQPNNSQQSTYSSPYAKPPPQASPPIKSEGSGAPNTQALPPAPVQLPTAQPVQYQPQQASNIPTTSTQSTLSPEIEKAIAQFRANMLNVLSKQTSHAAQIIDTAITRARGLPVLTNVPPAFVSTEKTIVSAVQNMISEMQAKRQRQATSASPAPNMPNAAKSTPTPSVPTPSPAPTATVEAEIQRRIKGFRDTMVVALKKKTDQAEAIIDMAINRAQGLPSAGPMPGWEEADRLMIKSVTQIIADARRAHGLLGQRSTPTPATASQPVHQSPVPRQAPSASPAPAQPPAPATGSSQPNQGIMTNASSAQFFQTGSAAALRPAPPSISRPGISIQRPAPMGIARPGVNSISRPSVMRKDSSGTPTAAGPSVSTPTPTHNVSSPAPPSAGVVDQIAGQKRPHDDAFSNGTGSIGQRDPTPKAATPASTPNMSTPAPPSAGVVDQIGQKRAQEDGHGSNGGIQQSDVVAKSITPAPAPAPAPAPTPNMFSPAPPSAGVVDQIAGQKRHLDEGPGRTSSEPEAKKPALSS